MIALSLPAAVGLILLGRPLLATLYQRGAFDAAATAAVYTTLRFFALGLVGHVCLELVARSFFAEKDTVTPLVVAVGSGVANVLLGVLLMDPLGTAGLALANSLAISGEVLVLMLILRRRWGHVEGRAILKSLVRVLGACLVMGVAVVIALLGARQAGLSGLPVLVVGGLVGVVTYLIAGLVLGVQELRRLPTALLGR